jgi:hypothetical protein
MTEQKRASGRPWFLALELTPEAEKQYRSISDLDSFRVSIREKESHRLMADMADEPMEFPGLCADVLERAQTIVREAGPTGSNTNSIQLWSCRKSELITVNDYLPDFMPAPLFEMAQEYDTNDWKAGYDIGSLLKQLRERQDRQNKFPQPPGEREE